MTKILFAALFLSVVNFGAALAQTQTGVQSVAAERKNPQVQVRYQQQTNYDFYNDEVEGTRLGPDGVIVDSTRKTRMSSLVKPRLTFIPEMLKSVEDL